MKEIGDYILDQPLGAGATAKVYLAHRKGDGLRVALKVFHPGLWDREDLRRRASGEVQTVLSLSHPNIVGIHDSLLDQDPPGFALQYVEGVSLEEFQPRLPYVLPEASILILLKILCALQYAHSKGVIHRDLKPANILIGNDGRVMVSDFGLAKMSDVSRLTLSGTILGSPDYMSPEQARGEPASDRSDVFSAGSILYFLITGTRPFTRHSPLATLAAVSEARCEPVRLRNPKVSANLARILARAMARKPEDRFESAESLGQALSGYLSELGLSTEELSFDRWLVSPTESSYQALKTIAASLTERARKETASSQLDPATETLAHLSLVAPESAAIADLMEGIGLARARERRGKRLARSGSIVAALFVFAACLFAWRGHSGATRAKPEQPKAPVQTVASAHTETQPETQPIRSGRDRRGGKVRFELPEDVHAFWDGRPLDGKTFLPHERVGTHLIRLEKAGADPIVQNIFVSATEPTVIRVR